jgi:hypothetical protein
MLSLLLHQYSLKKDMNERIAKLEMETNNKFAALNMKLDKILEKLE